jgi:hypothetical protein
MHVAKIVHHIKEKFHRDVPLSSLTTILYKYAEERRKTFYKDKKKKNTYGLLEWREQRPAPQPEPPTAIDFAPEPSR